MCYSFRCCSYFLSTLLISVGLIFNVFFYLSDASTHQQSQKYFPGNTNTSTSCSFCNENDTDVGGDQGIRNETVKVGVMDEDNKGYGSLRILSIYFFLCIPLGCFYFVSTRKESVSMLAITGVLFSLLQLYGFLTYFLPGPRPKTMSTEAYHEEINKMYYTFGIVIVWSGIYLFVLRWHIHSIKISLDLGFTDDPLPGGVHFWLDQT